VIPASGHREDRPARAAGRRPESIFARRGGSVELLRVPAAVFGFLASVRGGLYDRGLLPVQRLDVPVVCVGNLTTGGTGKTPTVMFVACELARRGLRPGILSRGFKKVDGAGDEARVVARHLPEVPHVEDSDRVRGGLELERRCCDVVVLDVGFQHRRLHRDLDLVLVDATRPWGLPGGTDGEAVRAVLPRGLLREAPSALARADALVVTRSDQVDAAALAALEGELDRQAPGRPILLARHRPSRLGGSEGERPLSELAGREVDLVSGLGNPEAFERTVSGLGARIREHRRFDDHHAYGPSDLDGLGEDGRLLVTSEKDAVKLPPRAGLRVLEVELALERGTSVFEALLDALPAARAQRERDSVHEGLHG